jgi:hypothetical protein
VGCLAQGHSIPSCGEVWCTARERIGCAIHTMRQCVCVDVRGSDGGCAHMGANGCFLDSGEESTDRVRMQHGHTALIKACMYGRHLNMVSLLLERGGQEEGLVESMMAVKDNVSLVCEALRAVHAVRGDWFWGVFEEDLGMSGARAQEDYCCSACVRVFRDLLRRCAGCGEV